MTLSPREKAVVLIGVIIALLLSAKLMVFPFLLKVGSIEESLEAKTELLRRYRSAAGEIASMETRKTVLTEEIETMEGHLFNASTPSLASAELQSKLEKMVKRRRAKVKSVRTLKAEEMTPYNKIGVEITFYSDIRSLLDLLYDVEGDSKGLSIAQMNLHYQESADQRRLRTTLKVESGSKSDDR